MPELYEAGHLVKLYWEPDPVGAAAVLEEVGNITGGDLERGSTKNTTEVTVRGKKIDSHFVSPVRRRSPWSFTVTLEDDAQAAALQTAFDNSTVHAWQQRGVDPDGSPSGLYETVSGAMTSYKIVSPHGDGPIRAEMSVQPSGPQIINGTTIGA